MGATWTRRWCLAAWAALGLLGGCGGGTPIPTPAGQPLTPGHFESPWIHLERLQGQKTHLHTAEVRYRPSDAKLFQCSYTFGVVDASDPANMSYLGDAMTHVIPNSKLSPGCFHLAWDPQNPNIVYTTHHGNLSQPVLFSGWDISKKDLTRDPTGKTFVQMPVLQEPGISYEGIDVSPTTGYIYVAEHDKGLAVYQRTPGTYNVTRVGGTTGFVNAFTVRIRDDKTAIVADGSAGIVTVDISNPTSPQIIGKVAIDGESEDLAMNGNTVFVAAGQAGMVAVDISNLAAPKILSTTDTIGNAVAIAYSAGGVYVAAWNDIKAYDVTDATKPVFIGAYRTTVEAASAITGDPDQGRGIVTARNLGIAAYGDIVFNGNWYLLHSFRIRPDRVAPMIRLPEDGGDLIDFGPLGPGGIRHYQLEIMNQGTAPLTLYDIWASGSFSVDQKQMRIQPGDKAILTVAYNSSTTNKEEGQLNIMSDDPDQPTRTVSLIGNSPGIGIGKPLPNTKAMLVDGTDWQSSQTKGKVMLLAYWATF